MPYYAIYNGKNGNEIVNTWQECVALTYKIKGSSMGRFENEDQAKDFLENPPEYATKEAMRNAQMSNAQVDAQKHSPYVIINMPYYAPQALSMAESCLMFKDVLESAAYKNLTTTAKALLPHLGLLYQPHQSDVSLSRNDAGEALGCGKKAIKAAFDSLVDNGFIELIKGHCHGQPRTFRLTWMPYNGEPSTNEWKSIGANT